MMTRMIPALAAALMLSACQESATHTAKDVAEARDQAAQKNAETRADASKEVAKANDKVADAQQAYAKTDESARKVLTRAESDAMIKTANANYDVAVVEADGRHKIAREKCDGMKGVDKDACQSTADATLLADKAGSTATRDASLVQAEHHD